MIVWRPGLGDVGGLYMRGVGMFFVTSYGMQFPFFFLYHRRFGHGCVIGEVSPT